MEKGRIDSGTALVITLFMVMVQLLGLMVASFGQLAAGLGTIAIFAVVQLYLWSQVDER